MKKLYFLSVLALTSLAAGAQCVVNQSVFSGPNDYRILPDTITNLPISYVGVGYTTDLQFHVQPDTVTQLGTFPIIDVSIDSIVGIPANFSYLPNPSSGIFPGGSYNCVAVTGNPVAGQEVGGPTGNGIYPIIIYYTATVNVFNVPTDFPTMKTGYKIQVLDATGMNATENINFSVAQNAPNPSDKNAEFSFTNPVNGNVQFTLYNILGETVQRTNISAVKGENRFSVNTGELPAGVYLYTFRSGNIVVTRRMTVSH